MGDKQRDQFRTIELTLAAYLVYMGWKYISMEQRHSQAVWIFERSNTLMDDVKRFNGREAKVDPKEYYVTVTSVKKELFPWLQERGLMEQNRAEQSS